MLIMCLQIKSKIFIQNAIRDIFTAEALRRKGDLESILGLTITLHFAPLRFIFNYAEVDRSQSNVNLKPDQKN